VFCFIEVYEWEHVRSELQRSSQGHEVSHSSDIKCAITKERENIRFWDLSKIFTDYLYGKCCFGCFTI